MKKIVVFSLPMILTGLLQTLYNAADLVVVGHFDGSVALAAVGSTGSLTNLVVGLFMGLSVGAGVCVANYVGAKEYEEVNKVLHTSVITACILGVTVGAVGIAFAEKMLMVMGTPDNVIDYSALYLRIVFCGIPALMLYNYCAAMLRSTGDTKHPLIFLSISGLVNVLLNLLFVAVFNFGVAGVAIATIISQYLSAVMIIIFLCRSDSYMRLTLKNLKIDRKKLLRILYIGVPSGLQSMLFALSNVIIQSSINEFGDISMAGNSAAANLEQFVYISMNAVSHTTMTFVGQNVGAKTYNRIKRILADSIVFVVIVGLSMAGLVFILRYPLLDLYAPQNDEVARIAIQRMVIILPTYFLCGFMECFNGALRAMGKSLTGMIVSLLGACGLRILWIKTVFRLFPSLTSIYVSYPVSWAITALVHFTFCLIFIKYYIKHDMSQTIVTEELRIKRPVREN